MTAAGEDILAWLGAAISLHEERAHALGGGKIKAESYGSGVISLEGAVHLSDAGGLHEDEVAWIVLNDPESVLRRCAADRKILELHAPVILRGGGGASYYETTRVCRSCEPPKQFPDTAYPCPTVLAIAEGYGWTDPTDSRRTEGAQTPPTEGDQVM